MVLGIRLLGLILPIDYIKKARVECGVIFLVFCFLFAVSIVPFQNVAAQDLQKSKGLTLSPLRSELNIEPGTSLDGTFTVKNSTDKTMMVSLSAEEFSVINQQYDYAFTAESDITKWIRFDSNDVDLVAGELRKIKYAVAVPLSAEPGGRYISLFASTDTGASDSAASSRQRIASLVYITVLGDVSRDGNLLSLTSPWLISGQTTWSAAIQNTGTTHFRSDYEIKLNNIIGNQTVATKTGSSLILPGSVRLVSGDLPIPNYPGFYKITYTIGLGDKPSIIQTRYLLYLPLYAIITIIIIVIAVTAWLFGRRKRLSKH